MILALTLALLGLLLPSADYHVFNGLPLSSPLEAVILALLAPLCVSRGLRRLYPRLARRVLPGAHRVFLAGAALVLGAKLLLLASGTSAGFLACYRSPLTPPPAGPCERSWENPFFRFSVTRIDRVIDFTPAVWDLTFFNSLRFNFYPWVEGVRRRDRLPIEVTWRGPIETPEPVTLAVTYIGEGSIRVPGATPLEAPRRYDSLATVPFTLPAGRHEVVVTYAFDDGSRVGDTRPTGPYATFRLLQAPPGRGDVTPTPVAAAPPPPIWRGLAALLDLAIGGFAATLVLLYASVLRREWAALPFMALAGPAAYLIRTGPWLPRGLGFQLVALLLFAYLLARNTRRRLLLGYFALLYVNVFMAFRMYPRLSAVSYRTAGDDWLTYESQARTILETWSLEGGETVFFIQPLFRYVRFLERLLFGDGDPLIVIATLTCLGWGLFWVASRLWSRRPSGLGRAALFVTAGAFLLLLANSATVVTMVNLSLSEHVTWLLLPFAFATLYAARTPREWLLGAALVACSLITRANHGPALLAMLFAFLGRAYPVRPRAALGAAAIFLAIALLPMAHNLYYGGQLVPFTTGAAHPSRVALSPARLVTLAGDGEALRPVWEQLRGALFLTTGGERLLQVVLRGLQAAWLIALVVAWRARRQVRLPTVVLLAVPAFYLALYAVYEVWNYYPRHILAAHFAMGLVAMYAAARVPPAVDRPTVTKSSASSGADPRSDVRHRG